MAGLTSFKAQKPMYRGNPLPSRKPTISPTPKPKYRTAIIAMIIVLVVIFGGIATGVGLVLAGKNNIKENGVAAVGTPTGNVINFRESGRRHNSDRWRVEYTFEVEGETFLAYGEASEHIRSDAQNRADQIGEVTVYYLPEDPEKFYVYDFGNFF